MCAGSRASLAASELVVELHRRLGPKLKPKIAKIGAGFVDTCLGHLRAAVSRVTKRRAELAPAATEDGGIVDGSVDVGDEGVGVGGIGGEAVADEAGVAESEEAPLGFQGKPMSMRSGTRSGARHHVRRVSLRKKPSPPKEKKSRRFGYLVSGFRHKWPWEVVLYHAMPFCGDLV